MDTSTHNYKNDRAEATGYLAQIFAPNVIIQLIVALLFLGGMYSKMGAMQEGINNIPREYIKKEVYLAEKETLLGKIDSLTRASERLEREIMKISDKMEVKR